MSLLLVRCYLLYYSVSGDRIQFSKGSEKVHAEASYQSFKMVIFKGFFSVWSEHLTSPIKT